MTLVFLIAMVVIAHGIWVDEEELNILKEKDISVAITTESNLNQVLCPSKSILKKA